MAPYLERIAFVRKRLQSEHFLQISSSAYTLLLACKQLPPLSESNGTVQLEI